MPVVPLVHNRRQIRLHSALTSPNFAAHRVLSADVWEYVSLWLRREKVGDALIYWEQAREFFQASQMLSQTSSPLTSYYCMLNAAKTLLSFRGRPLPTQHGVTGKTLSGKRCLRNERVLFLQNGILPGLIQCLGDVNPTTPDITLYDLLLILPFLHRAFCLTYTSQSEIFIPVSNPAFVLKSDTEEAWFSCEIPSLYVNAALPRILPNGFERDRSEESKCVIRRRRRFRWRRGHTDERNLARLVTYHRSVRQVVLPIIASENRWYIRKQVAAVARVNLSPLPVMFAAMHRLSELSRYEPAILARHAECQHNWLLNEFLKVSPAQFVSQIASEITGMEFIKPDAVRLD